MVSYATPIGVPYPTGFHRNAISWNEVVRLCEGNLNRPAPDLALVWVYSDSKLPTIPRRPATRQTAKDL